MFTTTKYNQTENERYIRRLARMLLANTNPAHRHGWTITQLLAAYKIGQTLNELTMPWWWNLNIHEIDLLFPWDENAVIMIADDMQRNGYAEDCPPIVLFENKVLDGKLRLEAARRVQTTPRFEIFNGETRAALEYAIRLNWRRQNLIEEQSAAILAEMAAK